MSVSASTIRVLVVDDHWPFRQSLCQICEIEDGFEVIGEAENGRQAVEMARHLQPDVILMDIRMPILDGIQATRLIVQENPAAQVIALTVQQDDDDFAQMTQAGARACLLKDVDECLLFDAIRAVCPEKQNRAF